MHATLAMAFLGIKLYNKFQENFGIDTSTKSQNEWMRYLDDCFIYWDTRIGPFISFLHFLGGLPISIAGFQGALR